MGLGNGPWIGLAGATRQAMAAEAALAERRKSSPGGTSWTAPAAGSAGSDNEAGHISFHQKWKPLKEAESELLRTGPPRFNAPIAPGGFNPPRRKHPRRPMKNSLSLSL